jgi:hypothetical protein
MEEPGTTQRGHDHELVEEALAGLAMLLIRGVKASPDPAAAALVAGAGLRALGDWVEQTAADLAGKDAGASAGLVEWPLAPQGAAVEMAPAVRQPFLLIDDEDEAPDAAADSEAAAGPVDSGPVPDLTAAVCAADLPVPEMAVPEAPVAAPAAVAAADPAVGEESGKTGVVEAAFPLVAAVTVSGVVPDAPGLAPFPLAAVLGESGGTDPEPRAVPGLEAMATPLAEDAASADAVVSGDEDGGIAESAVEASAAEVSAVAVAQVPAVPVLEKLSAAPGPRVSGEWVTSSVPVEVPEESSVRSGCWMMPTLVWLAVLAALAWGLRAIVQHFFSALFSA